MSTKDHLLVPSPPWPLEWTFQPSLTNKLSGWGNTGSFALLIGYFLLKSIIFLVENWSLPLLYTMYCGWGLCSNLYTWQGNHFSYVVYDSKDCLVIVQNLQYLTNQDTARGANTQSSSFALSVLGGKCFGVWVNF